MRRRRRRASPRCSRAEGLPRRIFRETMTARHHSTVGGLGGSEVVFNQRKRKAARNSRKTNQLNQKLLTQSDVSAGGGGRAPERAAEPRKTVDRPLFLSFGNSAKACRNAGSVHARTWATAVSWTLDPPHPSVHQPLSSPRPGATWQPPEGACDTELWKLYPKGLWSPDQWDRPGSPTCNTVLNHTRESLFHRAGSGATGWGGAQ